MSVRNVIKLFSGGIAAGLAAFQIYPDSISYVINKSPTQNDALPVNLWRDKFNFMFSLFDSAIGTKNDNNAVKNVQKWDWNWDGMHDYNETDGKINGQKIRTGVRHLFLIRHGQYHYAKDDVDCQLTPLGREQLNYTGIRLKELNFPYKKVYYSTMTRAIESAELILNHLTSVPAEPSSELREGAPYLLEPPLPYYQPTEKDLKEDGTRIEKAFKTFVHRADNFEMEDSYEVYVCHANVIRYFVCRALQLAPEAWIRFSLDHGSITWIVVRPNGCVTLRWLGNSGHMPPDKISVQ